jgi:hypothetical protein
LSNPHALRFENGLPASTLLLGLPEFDVTLKSVDCLDFYPVFQTLVATFWEDLSGLYVARLDLGAASLRILETYLPLSSLNGSGMLLPDSESGPSGKGWSPDRRDLPNPWTGISITCMSFFNVFSRHITSINCTEWTSFQYGFRGSILRTNLTRNDHLKRKY